jgi:hypothetical protein
MKIAFWENQLTLRGTTVACYDYAFYNRTLLGNESIVFYDTTQPHNDGGVIAKFKAQFKVYGVTHFSQVDAILAEEKCDALYVIEGGYRTDLVSKVCKTLTHCVFTCEVPHGDVYATLGPCGMLKGDGGKYPYLPFMVDLPDIKENWRQNLGIPDSATVFGRHGGAEQFDIGYVRQAVYNVAKSNPNVYFLFVNTPQFCESMPNIIHLAPIVDLTEKTKFINTCDAMLHARSEGETFGLAIGEFSIKNKPVFCTKMGDPAHIHILGDKAFWYTESTLQSMLVGFDKTVEAQKDWNAFKEYTPEKVMAIFKKLLPVNI